MYLELVSDLLYGFRGNPLGAEDGDEMIAVVRVAHEEGRIGTARDASGRRHAAPWHRYPAVAVAAWLEERECLCIPYAHLVSFYARTGFVQIEPEAAPAIPVMYPFEQPGYGMIVP
jgi:hypothetical protein